MADKQESSPQSAAMDTIIRELASYAVLFAVSWAVLNRDVVARAWMRLTRREVTADEARARRETADLMRAVSLWEHGSKSDPPRGGMYEAR